MKVEGRKLWVEVARFRVQGSRFRGYVLVFRVRG